MICRRIALKLTAPLVVLALAGCGEEPGVRVYEASAPAAYAWPETEPRDAVVDAGGTQWAWRVPAGWVDAPELGDQLLADYRFKGSTEDLPGRATVSMIPGEAGGVEANISRWRQQLFVTQDRRLGPGDMISDGMPVPWGTVYLVKLRGQYQGPHVPTDLYGAVLQVMDRDNQVVQSWFFKLVGDEQTVKANTAPLTHMVLSFRPAGAPMPDLPEDLFQIAPGDEGDHEGALQTPGDESPSAVPLDDAPKPDEEPAS